MRGLNRLVGLARRLVRELNLMEKWFFHVVRGLSRVVFPFFGVCGRFSRVGFRFFGVGFWFFHVVFWVSSVLFRGYSWALVVIRPRKQGFGLFARPLFVGDLCDLCGLCGLRES
ncbi:MAG TPA: hypothetical protein VHC70_02685 [Phycisphaerales bacterium]|nr:hypothetical protein [Phycisphaerales bacterium]